MKKILFTLLIINIFLYNTAFANHYYSENSDYLETSSSNIQTPTINSKNAIVLDRKTLIPLYEKNAYTQVPMASTTKILTCILALENSSKSDIVTVSKKAANITGSTLGLKYNSKISMNDLLYGLMLRSGNDCAIAIAEHISGSVENFSVLMNTKAFELGLSNSNFITPHGLDNPNHYTTAYDLALLTNYALKNEDFKKIVSTKKQNIYLNTYNKEISNTNELLGSLDGIYGVKTGFTFNAGRCLVSAYCNNNLDIIVVVLGADTKSIRTQDSKNLVNYISSNYTYVDISHIIEEAFLNFIPYFNEIYLLEKTTSIPKLKLENIENYNFPLLKNDINNLRTNIYINKNFSPKLSSKTIVGKVHLFKNETLLCSINILLENDLFPNNYFFYLKKFLYNYK